MKHMLIVFESWTLSCFRKSSSCTLCAPCRFFLKAFLAQNPNTSSNKLATRYDLDLLKLELQNEIVQSSNKIILWVVSILGGFGVFFLGILAKGFHWL